MKQTAPIYVVAATPAAHAQRRKEQALDLGCSPEYAEALRLDVEARTVQVSSAYEANAIQSQRGVS